jgi:hypothetical protein
MDINKIPVKYSLGLWKTLPAYPTRQDVIYEIHVWMTKNKRIDFTEKNMDCIFDVNGNPTWVGTKIEDHFRAMLKDGTIKESNRVLGDDKARYIIETQHNPFK